MPARRRPACRRSVIACGPGGSPVAAEGSSWFQDSSAEVERARRRIEREWATLRALADVELQGAEDSSLGFGEGGWLWERTVRLLVSTSLDLIRPFATPFQGADAFPPLPDSGQATSALLGADFHLFVNYALSPNFKDLSKVGLTFWQATFYLRSLHASAGEASVQDTADGLRSALGSRDTAMSTALERSRLLARQNYLTAASFGYFLRRCQQRLRLERGLRAPGGAEAVAPRSLEDFAAGLEPETAVELVRMATRAGSAALERRATALFGDEGELVSELRRGPEAVTQMRCGVEARRLLDFEAAAFGAALFEAEEVAVRLCDLQYTTEGSRGGIGGFQFG